MRSEQDWLTQLIQQAVTCDRAELDWLVAANRPQIDALPPRRRERLIEQLLDACIYGRATR
jgi:hypothetical protein